MILTKLSEIVISGREITFKTKNAISEIIFSGGTFPKRFWLSVDRDGREQGGLLVSNWNTSICICIWERDRLPSILKLKHNHLYLYLAVNKVDFYFQCSETQALVLKASGDPIGSPKAHYRWAPLLQKSHM